MSLAEMVAVTPEAAVRYPVWSMSAKISIDSATMMNKGLELIEARPPLPVPEARVEVLVHPQSTVHGLVQYADGSVVAQARHAGYAHADRPRPGLAGADGGIEPRPTSSPWGGHFAPDPVRVSCVTAGAGGLAGGRWGNHHIERSERGGGRVVPDRRLGFLLDIAAVVEETPMARRRWWTLPAILALDAAARVEAARSPRNGRRPDGPAQWIRIR